MNTTEAPEAEAQTGDLGTETEVEEQTETELHEQTETETVPEPEAVARSERDIEQATDKIDRENERHAKRVAEIMGDDFAGVEICPLCFPFSAGWIFPGAPLSPELIAAVDLALGREAAPALRQDPDTEPCAKCGGWGDLLTGALTERSRIKACPDCGGSGYKTRAAQPPPAGHVASAGVGGPQVFVPDGAPPPPAPVYDYATGKWVIP